MSLLMPLNSKRYIKINVSIHYLVNNTMYYGQIVKKKTNCTNMNDTC